MKGRIIKGISGFYYVFAAESGIYECKAKGIFRKQKRKPLVGDEVEIEVIDEQEQTGNVCEILPRKNVLIRPEVSNIDFALLIFAAAKPAPGFNLLDRFLISMEFQNIPVVICFNKMDLIDEKEKEKLAGIYNDCGASLLFTSVKRKDGLAELKNCLRGKTAAVAGPSGVGKSSLINLLAPDANMEIGSISKKIERGKNTTRHSQLIPVSENTYIMDTPGFSSLDVLGPEKEELWKYYEEFIPYEQYCRFRGCSHIHEPGCGIKEALAGGKISPVRYENYRLLYQELKEIKKY